MYSLWDDFIHFRFGVKLNKIGPIVFFFLFLETILSLWLPFYLVKAKWNLKAKKNCWLINAIHLLCSWSRDSFIALLKRIKINHFRLLIQHA